MKDFAGHRDKVLIKKRGHFCDVARWQPQWTIAKYDSEQYDMECKPLAAKAGYLLALANKAFLAGDFASEKRLKEQAERLMDQVFNKGYEVNVIKGNLLLNEGINVMWTLICGGTATAFNNANSYIGVGDDSSTAADATQTGLLGTNTAYVGMETGYPSYGSDQKATWRSEFDGTTGNFSWQEFTVANGNSNSATNLNRLVSDQGTKASDQTWTVDLAITLS